MTFGLSVARSVFSASRRVRWREGNPSDVRAARNAAGAVEVAHVPTSWRFAFRYENPRRVSACEAELVFVAAETAAAEVSTDRDPPAPERGHEARAARDRGRHARHDTGICTAAPLSVDNVCELRALREPVIVESGERDDKARGMHPLRRGRRGVRRAQQPGEPAAARAPAAAAQPTRAPRISGTTVAKASGPALTAAELAELGPIGKIAHATGRAGVVSQRRTERLTPAPSRSRTRLAAARGQGS